MNTPAQNFVDTDDAKSSRLGWLILLIGFGGFMLWAWLAPMDEGAPIPGTVTLVGNRKTIQHSTGGVVDKVLVKEGQTVKAGDVLVKLNTTKSNADLNIVRSQWISLRGAEARLGAERSRLGNVRFPQWFDEHTDDPRVQETVRVQNELFRARNASINNELSALQETEAALVRTLQNVEQSMVQKQSQVRFSEEQMQGLREMAKEGFLARNRLLDAERSNAAVAGSLADDNANLARTRGQLGEVRMRMAQRRSEYQREVQTQLAEVQHQADELESKLSAVQFDNTSAEVRSPVDGVVTALQVFTEGGVVGAGGKLMEIVPVSDKMEIEGQLAVHLVDKIVPGLPVSITFPALQTRKTPIIQGHVRTVSADRLTDQRTGAPFYLVKIEIPPESYKALNGQVILPGMPADSLAKIGERTLIDYLVKPFTDRLRTALTER